MNKLYFRRNFFLTDWCHMRCKNTIEISSICWNVLLWIFSNCYVSQPAWNRSKIQRNYWVAVNVKWSLSKMSQNNQKSITQFFKSNQKQQNLTPQRPSQKSEAQVPTHNIKINDKPFHPPADCVFPKHATYYFRARNIGLKSFHGFIIMKSNFFVL